MSSRIICLVSIFLAAAVSSSAQMPPVPFTEDAPFPDIVLPDLSGNPLSISHFKGQKLVLHIFASW